MTGSKSEKHMLQKLYHSKMDLKLPSFRGAGALTGFFADDPLARYYNLDGLTDVCLTCDVDWAPEYAIEAVLQAVEAHGHKFTIFSTHDSAVLQRAPSWLEVGLHPDFTRKPPSPWFDERMAGLKAIYPEAVGMRSHRNFFGNNIADLAKANGLIYDASVFAWNEPICLAHRDYQGLVRMAYSWEDGIHLDFNLPRDLSATTIMTPGLKILNVHPILIYLNSQTEDHRRGVTRRYQDLVNAPKAEIDAERNTGEGIANLWHAMLGWLAENNIRTHCLRDVARTAIR